MNHELFFELTVDLLCIANNQGYFLDVNQNFVKTLGYTKEELLARPFTEFVHPNDIGSTEEQKVRTNSGEDVSKFVNRYKRKDGSYVSLSWTARTHPTTGLIYGIARDVTSESETQLQLDQLNRALQEATIYVETDADGIITKVNPEFCRISGYSEDELIGKTHQLINSGYHSQKTFERLWSTIKSGNIWSGTLKNKRKDGTYYYVKTLITPIINTNNTIDKFVAIRQDITESIEVHSALKKTNKILNETSAIAKVGGWELDVATGELNWTDETFTILEVDKRNGSKPMLPEGLALFTDSSAPIIDRAVSRAIEFGEPYSLELEALTAKGNVKWVYTNGRATFDNGKVVTLSGTIQDIDERKKTEIAYKAEKQKSFQNAKLASLGELAASMAHEINNPLGIISGNAELLMEVDVIPETSIKKVKSIFDSTKRIAHIVQGLKKFSGKKIVNYTKKDISEIINEAISLVKPRLKTQRVKLASNIKPGCIVLCNEIEIEQVILNLINNAIDAISNLECREVEISLVEEDKYACILVEDSGKRIEEDIALKLFDPFFTTKHNSSNSGLGLSISREIMLEHKGDIKIDMSASRTRFKISLPLAS